MSDKLIDIYNENNEHLCLLSMPTPLKQAIAAIF